MFVSKDMKKENNFLKWFGIVLMISGAILVFSAIPLIQQSIVQVGPVSADIPEFNALRFIGGAVLVGLGILAFKNK